jgi:hypothetical protein
VIPWNRLFSEKQETFVVARRSASMRRECGTARTILGRKAIIAGTEPILMNSPTNLRDVGSFLAGVLIGVSLMVPIFALIVVNLSHWQAFLLFGAPIILALGITLQAVITAKARHQRASCTALGWDAVRRLTREV